MNSRDYFYKIGKLIYKLDGIYMKYGEINKFEISTNALWTLYALNYKDGVSQKMLSEEWDIPRQTINSIIKDFESKNWIMLKKIEGKKRESNIYLTKKGKSISNEYLSDLYKKEEKAFNSMSKPDRLIKGLSESIEIIKKNILK